MAREYAAKARPAVKRSRPRLVTPTPKEPDVEKFLRYTPTLVPYPEDRIVSTVTAQLPLLPDPLRLSYGPLLVTIETWSHGVTVARLPAAILVGEGRDDREALEALAENIAEFVEVHLPHAQAGRLGGTLAKQWASLSAMVDISAAHVVPEKTRNEGARDRSRGEEPHVERA